jgi:putative peptidoglycan lipid II flippase
MFRRLLNGRSRSVASAAALLGLASLLSRVVGFFRDRLLSGTFGAGPELDAYYAAFRAPDLIYNLFILGAVTAGFIPVMSGVMAGDGERAMDDKAKRLISSLLTFFGVLLVGASIIGAVTAPLFTPVLAPGFDAAQTALTVRLTRIMFLSPLFLGLSAVFGSVLQVRRRFFVYALAPVLYNVGIIGGTMALAPAWGIAGVALGVTVGSFLHLVAQLAACRTLGYRLAFRWDPRHDGVREVGRLMVPRTAGLAVSQINLLVLTGLASSLGAGSIAVFNLADNLQSFSVGIIGVSFAVASFPLIAELAAKGRRSELAAEFSKTVLGVLFLAIPATVAFLLLRAQIVRVVLGTGNFDWADTVDTADALAFFTLSLFAQALLPLVVRAFFALRDVVTPLLAGLVSSTIGILLAVVLAGRGMGTPGLALAFSVASIANVLMLWVLLRLRVGDLGERRILPVVVRLCVAAVLMAAAIQSAKIAIAPMVDMQRFVGIFTQGLLSGLLGLTVYVAAAYLMGSEEAGQVVRLYRRKVSPVMTPEVVQEEGTLDVE